MKVKEHLDNFIKSKEFLYFESLYEEIVIHYDFSNIKEIYNALINELKEHIKPVRRCAKQIEEYEKKLNTIFCLNTTLEKRGALATEIFDALIKEKIKVYSLQYEIPSVLSKAMYEEYTKFVNEIE